MPSLATRRLISASATLDPADRALLNLWVNRGLDDHALSKLTGISPDALHSRRDRIVQRLSAELGLPPADVRRALDEIAACAASTAPGERADDGMERVGALLERHPAFLVAVPVGAWADSEGRGGPGGEAGSGAAPDGTGAVSANGHHGGNGASSDNGAVVAGLLAGPAAAHLIFTGGRPVPAPAAPPIDHLRLVNVPAPEARAAGPSPPPRPPNASPPAGGDRRRRPALIAAVLLVALVAIVIAARSGGSATPRHRPATTSHTTPPAATTPTVAAASTTPARAPVVPGSTRALGGLPGGLSAVHGAVSLAGSAPSLELRLTITALPAVSGAHYEAWLFNSVVDSQALGAVPAGSSMTAYPLPAGAARYQWIDISVQPAGVINHSGESQLRAANPAHHRAAGGAGGRAARRSRHRRRSPRRSSSRRTSK